MLSSSEGESSKAPEVSVSDHESRSFDIAKVLKPKSYGHDNNEERKSRLSLSMQEGFRSHSGKLIKHFGHSRNNNLLLKLSYIKSINKSKSKSRQQRSDSLGGRRQPKLPKLSKLRKQEKYNSQKVR